MHSERLDPAERLRRYATACELAAQHPLAPTVEPMAQHLRSELDRLSVPVTIETLQALSIGADLARQMPVAVVRAVRAGARARPARG